MDTPTEGMTRTLVLELRSRPATEVGDGRVVALVHERGEHRASRGTVRVAD